MNRKKLTGIIVVGVVVVVGIIGGVIYAKHNSKPSEKSAFEHLINTEYSLNVETTKDKDGYNYELTVEGDKLTAEDVEHIATQAKSVAKNPDQIIVNQLKAGTKDTSFTGFFSPDLESKAIVTKDGDGKLITFKDGKEKDNKPVDVSAYSTNGSEKLDSVDILKITLSDDKDIYKQGNAIMSAIQNENKDNETANGLVVDISNSDNSQGVIIDNGNPNIEADYTSFKA